MKTKLLRTFVALLLTTLATATAWAADTEAPTVGDKRVVLKNVTETSISIKWNLATDNITPKEDLVYVIVITNKNGYSKTRNVSKCTSSIEFIELEQNTTYEINISAKDVSGNTLKYDALTVTTKADTEAPDVSNMRFTTWNITPTSIEIYWGMLYDASDNITRTQDLIQSLFYKKASDRNYITLVDKADWHAPHSFNVENLEPDTKYDFRIEVMDLVGNVSVVNATFSTRPINSAPTIYNRSVNATNITSNTVDLSWDKAVDDNTPQSELRYEIYYNDGRFDGWSIIYGRGDGRDFNNTTAKSLHPNTWHSFKVTVEDNSKNIAEYDIVKVKTMPEYYEKDKEAPNLSNKKLSVSNATDNSLTLNWTKAVDNLFDDEDLSYTVEFKLPSDARYSRDGVEQGNDISSSLVTGLSPNTTYEFRVRVKDRVGNTSTYDILTYTTSNAQDRTAPTISNKTVTATDVTYGSVALSWDKATDNVTKQENLQYSVFRDGVLCKKMKGETSYIVGDLKPSTRYTFEVRVEDEAGNISKYNTVQATTTAKPVTVTKYPLFIEGTQVTSANANDFWGDGGTIKYDPTTKTLHLNWADLYSTSNTLEIKDDITINLVGWTTISGNINAASSSKVTIKADDKYGENAQLKIQNGYFYGNCDLTIKNECTVEIDATSKGNTAGLILNSHQLSVYGSTLKVKGDGKNATISGISALSMTDCHITSDHKYDASSKTFLNASGYVAKDDIVISTEIIRVPVLVNDEIEVEGVTEDGALLSWVPATDDDTPQSDLEYTLYTMRRYGDTDYTGYASGRNLTSCKLYNLQPNTEYYAIVRVEDKDGNMTFYKETSFKTLPESDKVAPTLSNGKINVTDVTYSSATISWAKASDDRTAQDKLYYIAGYKKSSEPESGLQFDVYNAAGNGNDMTSCTIENLDPETSYDFYVVVYDEASNGAAYTKQTVVTEALPDVTAPSLGNVTISVDDVTEKSIAMTWSPATDDRTPQDKLAYTVEYKKADESVWNANNVGNANSYAIEGLTKGTDYDVRISVADEAGNMANYGGFTITTADPSAINEVAAEGVDDNAMYSTSGVRVSENFRGVVIKNGKKYFNK